MVHSQYSSQSDVVKIEIRSRPPPMTPHFSGGKTKVLTVVHTAQESVCSLRPLTSPTPDHSTLSHQHSDIPQTRQDTSQGGLGPNCLLCLQCSCPMFLYRSLLHLLQLFLPMSVTFLVRPILNASYSCNPHPWSSLACSMSPMAFSTYHHIVYISLSVLLM